MFSRGAFVRKPTSFLALVIALISVAGFLLFGPDLPAGPAQPSLAAGFRDVPVDARLRMYWRIFGPAWSEPEIDRQLALMKAAGLGGTTAYFLYPVALDDPARGIVNQRFMSAEFLRTFGYAARKAAAMGLRFSVNGGTGWPFGGPTVGPGDAARRLKEVRVPAGGDSRQALSLGEGEQIIAAFLNGREVTSEATAGLLPNPLTAELRVYLSGPAGMQVKRPSYGGEGLAINHYDGRALTRWLESNVRPLLDAAPGLIEGIGCDSLEVYHANWTGDMPQEFRKRRGYDLLLRLPELFDDGAAATRGLRFDFWRTLTELTEERFTATLGDWCGRRRVNLEMEPYGTPPNPMTAAAHISMPTGEHYEWKGFAVQRYVASMAHIAGRPVVGAEAWTWAGLPNRLGDTLSDLKLVSDMTFLLGANDLTGVDFPYSPESAGSPGWMPYYGPVMGAGNPQWKFFPALVAYLNRCQWMLRQGEPVRKVAVYLPVEDALSAGPVDQMLLDFAVRDRLATGHPTSEFGLRNGLKHHSDLIHGLIRAGYDFDGLDFWAMTRWGQARGGRLVVGPAAYEAVILPDLEFIDASALERIVEFCRAGGTIVAIARLPGRAAGLRGGLDSDKLRRLVVEMFGDNPVPGRPHSCGKGRGIFVASAGDTAAALTGHVMPSIRMTPLPDRVGFVHRRMAGREIYFFANVGPEPVRFQVEFPGPARRLEAWDAMDGRIRQAGTLRSRLIIFLPDRGSLFVVSGAEAGDARPPLTARNAQSPFAAAVDAGTPAESKEPKPKRIDLDLEWSLTFDGPDAPPPVARLKNLASWTDLPGGRFFSGTGIYRAAFDWTGPLPDLCLLSFEQIREAAEVRLNGRSLGILFCPPLSLDVGPALKQGPNELEITVVNLPLNRFLGLPDEDLRPLRTKYGARFSAPEEKKVSGGPAPSGIIGKVWLERRIRETKGS